MTEVGRRLDRRAPRRRITRRETHGASGRRLHDRIGYGWSGGTALAWVAGIGLILLVEPAPADPEVASVLGEVVSTTLTLGLSVMLLGLAARYRFGLAAAAATGGLLLATSIACPLSGHHTFGAWWLAELAVVGGLTALGVAGYRRATGTGE